MDWPGSMGTYGFGKPNDEEVQDDEDFYSPQAAHNASAATNGEHTLPGAVEKDETTNDQHMNANSGIGSPAASTASNAEQRKAENQKRTEELRAKLLANRTKTPAKGASRRDTPAVEASVSTVPAQPKPEAPTQQVEQEQAALPSDMFGLETLLAEGKAAAEAKEKDAQTQAARETASAVSKVKESESQGKAPPGQQPGRSTRQNNSNAPNSVNGTHRPTSRPAEGPKQPNSLTDPYYADLAMWLDITGYHDIKYRQSKLHTIKERKQLEQEAARIAARLQTLNENERATIDQLRSSVAPPISADQHPPPLPTFMPNADDSLRNPITTNSPANDAPKRPHSPGFFGSAKAPRHRRNDFQVRGANDSPDTRYNRMPRPHSPSQIPLDRRISYSDSLRRNSFGEYMEDPRRDPSLERRQGFYGHNGENGGPASRGRYEAPPPQPRWDPRGRPSLNSRSGSAFRASGPTPMPGTGLDLRQGDVRYFIIKSWNHENVTTAMRDGFWTTQEKNEAMLTEAFHTCRYVVLLFSVNKSMAFQGYAIMASPPDPALSKPAFCTKLNWGTSPAFALRWISMTPVHFRLVGHLKNELNRDERGSPLAVLVGKDGQEIAQDAGCGLCEILDDAEEEKRGKEEEEGRLYSQVP